MSKTLTAFFGAGFCALATAIPAFGGYSDAVLRNRPVGYWRLGEANITDPVIDASGNIGPGEYNDFEKDPAGLMVAQPGAIAGDSNTSVQIGTTAGFGEGDNGQVQLPVGGPLDLGTMDDITATLEAWFQMLPNTNEALPPGSFPRILHYNNGAGGQYAFGLVGNDSAGFPRRTVFGASGAGGGGGGIIKSGQEDAVPASDEPEWHHLVAVLTPGEVQLFLNGEDLGELSDSDPIAWQATQATIGGRTQDNGGHVHPFAGLIDELAVYNRVLSPAEIKLHYDIGRGAARLADLNGDTAVDAADAGIMFSGWGTNATPADINLDGTVDAADAGIAFSEWTGDPTAGAGEAAGEYNVGTGEIKVHANNVVNWYIQSSSGGLTGAPIGDLPGPGLVTDNNSRVGETALGKFSYEANLGNVAAPGLPENDLVIYWNSDLGQPLRNAPVAYVPEPVSLIVCGLGLFGLSLARRRA